MMTKDQKTQIRKFAQLVNGGKIKVRFVKDKRLRAWSYKRRNIIYFNKNLTNLFELYCLVFHEVGHLKIKSYSVSVEEYKAQMWGIQRASEMGYKRIPQMLTQEFDLWLTFDWNSDQRKFIMAARIYFEKQNRKECA
jgi:hypothetical protein